MKSYSECMITDKTELAPGIFELIFRSEEIANAAKPGQFVAVYCKDGTRLLPRPISICDTNTEAGLVRLVYRIAGKGTAEISTFKAGETVTVMGPLGNGYSDFLCENAVLFGGGIGIPPMLKLAKKLAAEGKLSAVVLGYRNKDTFLLEEFQKLGTVIISTDDGSLGTKGTVLDAFSEHPVPADMICACGPMPMLRGIKHFAKEKNVKAYLSLEERMACGIGACLGCVTKTKKVDHHSHVNNARICVEGPVFSAEEVEIG